MLQTFRKAFQIEDIRRKILYTLAMLFVVRLGSQLPTPGVDPTYIQNFFANQTGDSFNFFNAFTGGSFETMSIFALSITPYITSSIIIQLLTIAIPKLEEMQKEGEDGRKKLTALTRYHCNHSRTCSIYANTSGCGETNSGSVFAESTGEKISRWTVNEHSAEG